MKTYAVAFLFSCLFSAALGFIVIPLLKRLKFGQNILSYVSEHNYKSGTPTTGGIIFIISVIVAFLIFGLRGRLTLICLAVFIAYSLVGFTDDFIKIKLNRNEGLNVVQKTLFELVIAIVVAVFTYTRGLSKIYIPFVKLQVDLGLWFIPLCVFVFIATTNSVNLTDGLDGLAGGVTYVYFLCFSALILLQIRNSGSSLLTGEYSKIATLGICLAGSLIGFLFFNTYRASVFMGDTGSLALGGMVAITGVVSGNIFYIPVIGIMYVVSSISVILQVLFFKSTKGRRLFLMAPLHHHFQHKGYSESKIAFAYKFITLIVGVIALAFNI